MKICKRKRAARSSPPRGRGFGGHVAWRSVCVAPRQQSFLQVEGARGSEGPSRGHIGQSRGRWWATRWRRRWGVCFSAIRVQDDIALPEMRAKVRVKSLFYSIEDLTQGSRIPRFEGPKNGRVFATARRSRKWGRSYISL